MSKFLRIFKNSLVSAFLVSEAKIALDYKYSILPTQIDGRSPVF